MQISEKYNGSHSYAICRDTNAGNYVLVPILPDTTLDSMDLNHAGINSGRLKKVACLKGINESGIQVLEQLLEQQAHGGITKKIIRGSLSK